MPSSTYNDIDNHGLPSCGEEPEEEEEETCEENRRCATGPPVATGSIPDQAFTVGASCVAAERTTVDLPLAGLFRDPDGDPLSYSASSSSTAATAQVAGSTLTVTASDGKDDGDASLCFAALMEQSLPKAVFSKISLFIDERPFDHAVTDLLKGGAGLLHLTLSCEYPNPVTVSISPSSTRLNVTPATLQFNNTNWNTPQTVEVNSVGRIIEADNTTLQSFTLSHVAATTHAEGQAVQTTADLIVNLRPATDSFLDQLASEFGDLLLDKVQDQVTETILEESRERIWL